ncbi:hypothetical protein BZG35_09530 [Brevundimonas sp. LM2]|uniref:hypothetical protein n=1 Tax=Brevundimonas sp. LM2 TaxID=1938605 RepID=UPI000983A9CF|nr:hypothetical protein [Brevundimonas sp. LM2]AQR61864.1 hypothetical protein BZG35_09530 [Brevundimonas sp. LM2]
MPSPSRVRLSAYVSPILAENFEREAERLGLSTSGLLEQLIKEWAPTSEQYLARQMGHQTMMSLTFIAALAKKSLTEAEFKDARVMGVQAGKLVFGDVPPLPFAPDLEGPVDPRLDALHKALMDR